eukprot:TRINITY_DN6650_c2_g1_i1.p1 TRINITY_DN6650_c2_g1~~TRINITY_DN6650_c2_g1_i1.p1  ORF type:complete len:518 (-),score=199.71 TRINITY_DN6650_c2_g1_i1:27-1580(-)
MNNSEDDNGYDNEFDEFEQTMAGLDRRFNQLEQEGQISKPVTKISTAPTAQLNTNHLNHLSKSLTSTQVTKDRLTSPIAKNSQITNPITKPTIPKAKGFVRGMTYTTDNALSNSSGPQTFTIAKSPVSKKIFIGLGGQRPDRSLETNDIPEGISIDIVGLRNLISLRNWKGVAGLCNKLIQKSEDKLIEKFQYLLCRVISLHKLRNYKQALDEIDKHTANAANKSENLTKAIPFSLLILHAELLILTGKTPFGLDKLHDLLFICRREIFVRSTTEKPVLTTMPSSHELDLLAGIEFPPSFTLRGFDLVSDLKISDTINTTKTEDINLWRTRENRIVLSIATIFCNQQDYVNGLIILEETVTRYPNDAILASSFGRLFLQIGDIDAANDIFKQIENQTGKTTLTLTNSGLISMATKNYESAIEQFIEALHLDSHNVIAANNCAISHLYNRNPSAAILLLENTIQTEPPRNIFEPIIENLFILYDLQSDNAEEKKKSLLKFITQNTGDYFGESIMKLIK